MNYVTLNNGLTMPQLGFGVWQVEDDQATSAVAKALEVGYTSIDTAMIYENEKALEKLLKNLLFLVKSYLLQQKFGIVIKALKIQYVHLMKA
jgi:diketogulonate reductase-like aldo/keto reductase